MNVEFVNPVLVFGLFAPSDAPQPKPSQWRRLGPAEFWHASTRSSDTGEHRASLHQLDDREFDDLALAPADLPALAWAM